jgi:DNA mismatch repair protein MutL
MPPTSFPVVLIFLEMPPQEVDVNVHPAKTEVRFRQPSFVHDFIRDTVRTTLMQARPAASFATALTSGPHGASSSLLLDVSPLPTADDNFQAKDFQAKNSDGHSDPELAEGEEPPLFSSTATNAIGQPFFQPGPATTFPQSEPYNPADTETFHAPQIKSPTFYLAAPIVPPSPGRFAFSGHSLPIGYDNNTELSNSEAAPQQTDTLTALSTLTPLGQLRDSFILATNEEGLWIIDQHVAHERILFEKILRDRDTEQIQRQRLLMPLLIDMLPAQMITFAEIAEELDHNGFEVEPFGPRTLAVKAAPVGLEGVELERMLEEVLAIPDRNQQSENSEARRRRIAASIACHAAIKINQPLDQQKISWLLEALSKTEHPTACPHGRPIALRYSHKDIAKAFQRI